MTALTVPQSTIALAKMKQLLALGYCKATAIYDTAAHMLQQGFTKEEAKDAADQAYEQLA